GRASPNRSSHAPSLLVSSASPPKMTYRRLAPERSRSEARWKKADGVWFRTVTPSPSISRASSKGERATRAGTMTSLAPWASAPKISQTEKSKAHEWRSVQTSDAVKSKSGSDAEKSRDRLWRVTSVPLGRPVEPEV